MTNSFDDLATARLALIAITSERLASEQAGVEYFCKAIGCDVPAAWPPEHWEPHVFDVLRTQYARFPGQAAWHRYVALREPDGRRVLVGTLGAFWRPESPEECEVGYSILPEWEGNGYATEGVLALLELIRRDARIRSAIAHTFPELKRSIRVMEKCGFQFEGAGQEEGTVRYRLRFLGMGAG